MNDFSNRNLISRVSAWMIIDEKGRPFNGPGYSHIFFGKNYVQTYSEGLRDRKIRHEIIDIVVTDRTGQLNKKFEGGPCEIIDFSKKYESSTRFSDLRAEINGILNKVFDKYEN